MARNQSVSIATVKRALQEAPQLQSFLLKDVKQTDKTLGSGSYGEVVELQMARLVCAGKKIYDTLVDPQNQSAHIIAEKYYKECSLLSELRHPHIVKFLGICFLPDSQLPVLMMEKLQGSLDDLLEATPDIPLHTKLSILRDVALGLVFLHSRNPAVIHRDLTARNILLNSSMTAKIADLGNSRITSIKPGQLAQTMTKGIPGTVVYMPPEASTEHYGPSLDMFSFGHLSLFTAIQVFPGDLQPLAYSENKVVKARTELERRQRYILTLEEKMGKKSDLVVLIKECLAFEAEDRPTASNALENLEGILEVQKNHYGGMSRLELENALSDASALRRSPSEYQLKLEVEAKEHKVRMLRQELERTNHIITQMQAGKSQKCSDTDSTDYLKVTARDTTFSSDETEEGDTSSIYEDLDNLPVEEEPWYYGEIDRVLAEYKCKHSGDYLVRYSIRTSKYVLTCNHNGKVQHFMIHSIGGDNGTTFYQFEAKAFSRIADLLIEHIKTRQPITQASGAILTNAVIKNKRWDLEHSDVHVGRKIGERDYCEVFEATLKSEERVALKIYNLCNMETFFREVDILKQYKHPNIIRLIGVCANKSPLYIVMETMSGGTLLEFLRKKGSHQGWRKLCSMAIDACKGMEYLEQKNCIHRDLAARNCFVGDGDIVKISEFGMSRQEEQGIYIIQSGARNIPIKWTAPEGIYYGRYTTASDVWSYGILLWEIFSHGSIPYPALNNQETVRQVECGYRMEQIATIPSDVYTIMTRCWQYEPEERPTFSQIMEMLNTAYLGSVSKHKINVTL